MQLEAFTLQEPSELTAKNNHIDVAAGTLRDLRLVSVSSDPYEDEMPRRFYGLPVYLEFWPGFPYEQHLFADSIDEIGLLETAKYISDYLISKAGEFPLLSEDEMMPVTPEAPESFEGHEWGDYPLDTIPQGTVLEAVTGQTRTRFTEKNPEVEKAVAQQIIDRFDAGQRYTMDEAEAAFSPLLSGRGIRRAWERAREKRPPIGRPGRPKAKSAT